MFWQRVFHCLFSSSWDRLGDHSLRPLICHLWGSLFPLTTFRFLSSLQPFPLNTPIQLEPHQMLSPNRLNGHGDPVPKTCHVYFSPFLLPAGIFYAASNLLLSSGPPSSRGYGHVLRAVRLLDSHRDGFAADAQQVVAQKLIPLTLRACCCAVCAVGGSCSFSWWLQGLSWAVAWMELLNCFTSLYPLPLWVFM